MELVVSETRRKRQWYFIDGEYICKEGEVVCAKVFGKDLPSPEIIKNQRQIIQRRLPLNQRGMYRTEPDPVTTALWNDWQTRQSMGEAEIDN